MKLLNIFILSLIVFSLSCEKDNPKPEEGNWYKPAPKTSFDWDLRSDIPESTSYEAAVIDIDGFENDANFVSQLHIHGKKVIAYLSVGSLEDWRPDVSSFPTEVIGNNYPGWEGEKFLDISNIDALAPIMKARLDMIKEKGFDGIEPDNMDLNSWTTEELGFEITDEDVIAYSKWLAGEAHQRGLSIGQKNASDLADQLVNTFDWILLEDSFSEGFQDDAVVYIQKNKAVFATEYTDNITNTEFFNGICPLASSLQFTAILKHRELDAYISTCN